MWEFAFISLSSAYERDCSTCRFRFTHDSVGHANVMGELNYMYPGWNCRGIACGLGLDLTNTIFPRFVPNRVPSWWHLSLDGSMILNAGILVIVTAFITGALPAWKIANGQFFRR